MDGRHTYVLSLRREAALIAQASQLNELLFPCCFYKRLIYLHKRPALDEFPSSMANTDWTGLDWKLGRQQHESTQLHCRLLAGTGQISYVLTREREGDTIFRNGRCVHQLHELTNMPPGTSKPRHERCIQESESESVCLIEWDECSRSLCKRNLFLSCSQFSVLYLSDNRSIRCWLDGLAH